MSDNVTTITPTSIAADHEPERKVRTFRVLKRDMGTIPQVTRWDEQQVPYKTAWNPDAAEVGGLFGEGDFLLIEEDDTYSFKTTYPMRVVAEKRYRLADEDA